MYLQIGKIYNVSEKDWKNFENIMRNFRENFEEA